MLTLASADDHALVTASGELTAPEVVDAYRRFLDGPWSDAIWDLSHATLLKMPSGEIDDLVHALRNLARGRRRLGRSAAVSPQELEYGVARMFAALLEGEEHLAEVRVFRQLDEAETWLAQGRFQDQHPPKSPHSQ